MPKQLNRREFLRLSALALAGMAYNPFSPFTDEYLEPSAPLGRVTRDMSVFRAPTWPDGETVAYLHRDELINIYYQITPASGPPYNPVWYRVWNGYVHSAYVQKVQIKLNTPQQNLSETGHLGEITVPYSQIYQYSIYDGWVPRSRLYYLSTHWVVGIDQGPDENPWYRLFDELTREQYHVPAEHLHLIPDNEYAPISPQVPPHDKRIEVSLAQQSLTAYEGDRVVLSTQIS